MSVTLQEAQSIIDAHHNGGGHPPGEPDTISSFEEIKDDGFGYISVRETYLIHLSPSLSSFLLLVCKPAIDSSDVIAAFPPLSLQTIETLLKLIRGSASIPLPIPHTLDTTMTLIPYEFLLLSLSSSLQGEAMTTDPQPLSALRAANMLSPAQNKLLDLQLGSYLRQLHAIQNDWFGPLHPVDQQPADPSYSWQETFTIILEEALHALETRESSANIAELQVNGTTNIAMKSLPYEDVRRYLSRAIGFYLFDDADVPSLIWFTGSEEDVFVSLPASPDSPPIIAYIRPSFTHAMWGDPFLETFFLPPRPSTALLEGYTDGSGGPLIVFPRQRTKRLWYTLFLAVVTLLQDGKPQTGRKGTSWAREVLPKCIEALKDAPNY